MMKKKITIKKKMDKVNSNINTNKVDFPKIAFKNAEEWRLFLEKNHNKISGIWMKIAKKSSGIQSITYAEGLDEALCYGWIDGQRKTFDDKYFLQRFTPRRKNSNWSEININKAKHFIETGKMTPAGQLAFEKSKEQKTIMKTTMKTKKIQKRKISIKKK